MKEVKKCGVEKSSRLYQYLAAFSACLNVLCSGMHYGWTSTSFPKLLADDSDIQISDRQSSWIASIFLVGILVGASLGMFLVDRIGRKNVILIAAVPFTLTWIAIAFADSVYVILVARFVAGMQDGLTVSSLPLYIGEIADPKIRGLLGSCIGYCLISGMFVMSIIGSYLSITTAALASTVVPIMCLAIFYWMPQSPYYLIMKGEYNLAKNSLKTLRGMENVDDELERLIGVVDKETRNAGKFLELFTSKSNTKALIIVMGLRTVQQLSGYTVFTFYAQLIFKEAGDAVPAKVASIIYFGVQMVATGVSAALVDRIGRKPLMIFSNVFSSLMLLTEGAYFYLLNKTTIDISNLTIISVIALMVYVVVFSIGMQVIPMVLLTELFPTNVKAFAMSVCHAYYALVTTLIALFFEYTKERFGMDVPFLVFGCCCMLGLLFIVFYVPETKGKTLDQIQTILKGDDFKRTFTPMKIVDAQP